MRAPKEGTAHNGVKCRPQKGQMRSTKWSNAAHKGVKPKGSNAPPKGGNCGPPKGVNAAHRGVKCDPQKGQKRSTEV